MTPAATILRRGNSLTQKDKELPPCSEFLKGTSAVFQSFIAANARWDPLGRGVYRGDNRTFTDSPSDDFRTRVDVS
jgi:hypothetical protein